MPYVNEESKKKVDFKRSLPEVSGELNYVLTMSIINYLRDKGLCYQTCNDIVGALDNVKSEFKRRIQDPYEDMKKAENNDVYDYWENYIK